MNDPDEPFKWYFEIDSEWIKKYINQLMNKLDQNLNDQIDISWNVPIASEGFSPVVLPVNGYFSNTVEGSNSSLYLGNNHYNEGVWKKKHFIQDKLQSEYVLHLQSHAGHFLNQPKYYKGLYEILN